MVIKFDLQDIPQNVTIKEATLELYYLQGTVGVEKTMLYLLNKSWVDTTTTWLLRDRDSYWDSFGGDYDTTISASAPYAAESGWERFDVTSFINQFNKGEPNFGFILNSDRKDGNTGRLYPSSEYNNDSSLRPKLTVVYDDVVSILNNTTMETASPIRTHLTNGILSIATPYLSSGVLTVYSFSGQEIYSSEFKGTHNHIDLSIYSKGAYLLTVNSNGNKVCKIIFR